ncbi:MAG TPA: hypothetical protein PKE45_15510 [Caldilineaceae bacterium]|nr:hypothetical protein [Caldilineaceae bacterium]
MEEVRTLYPSEWGVPYPVGLAYSLKGEHLALLDKSSAEQPTAQGANLVIITPYEDLVATVNLALVVNNPINLAYDDAHDRLLFLNHERAELSQVAIGEDGIPDPATLARFDIAQLALGNANGMAVDPTGSQLFILDSDASAVVGVELDAGYQVRSNIDLSALGAADLRGIAVHPLSQHLFVVSPSAELLYELTQAGQLVNTYDLSVLDLVDVRGLAFGPSADLTDPPDTMHLFIADSNSPDDGEAAVAWQALANKLYLPLITESQGDVAPGSRRQPDPANSGQLFGRVLEVALEPEGSGGLPQRFVAQVASGVDDAEEKVESGATTLDSTDLELTQAAGSEQIVGIRFGGVDIPAQATIITAHIEFTADKTDSSATSLLFHGEATDDAAPFAEPNGDISRRTLTTASVMWPEIPAWANSHETHQTADLSPIVQEIVDRSGWSSGNAIAFLIT